MLPSHHARPLAGLIDELLLLRAANLHVFTTLGEAAWHHVGVANGHPVSVQALAYILVGHANHHLKVLRERYGVEV